MERCSWINVTVLLVLLASCLQATGFVAPMWIWLDVDSFRVGVGLWFTTGCGLQGTCSSPAPNVSFGYTTDDTWETTPFKAVRGLETVALASSVLLLLFLVVYRLGHRHWANMGQLNTAAFFTAVLNWMCTLSGLIVYCAYYWPVVGTSPLINHNCFPWSLLMCLVAAFVFIVVSVLVRVKCRERSELKHAIPVSGDSKMDMHPVTTHGLMHRYFSPLYRGIRGSRPALDYGGKSMQSMNTHLIGTEERNRVPAIDNAAFYGEGTTEAIKANYRHLPAYESHSAGTRRDPTYTHDQSYQTGDAMHHAAYPVPFANTSPRDAANNVTSEERVPYMTVTRPAIIATSLYVTQEARDMRLLDDGTGMDSRFSNEDRFAAGGVYLTREAYQKKGGLTVTELESNDGKQMTNHFAQERSDGVRPYDPTYIYRPYSEQVEPTD